MTCPKCGADVRHPPLKMTPKGTVEICDQCGAELGEPEPVATGFLKAMGVGKRRDVSQPSE